MLNKKSIILAALFMGFIGHSLSAANLSRPSSLHITSNVKHLTKSDQSTGTTSTPGSFNSIKENNKNFTAGSQSSFSSIREGSKKAASKATKGSKTSGSTANHSSSGINHSGYGGPIR